MGARAHEPGLSGMHRRTRENDPASKAVREAFCRVWADAVQRLLRREKSSSAGKNRAEELKTSVGAGLDVPEKGRPSPFQGMRP